MKRINTTRYLLLCITTLFVGSVHGQTVGTIGVGDINYSVADSNKLRPKENVISAIDSGLNNALLKTRKFTVLDYAQLSKRIAKQGRNLNDYYSKKYTSTEYSQAGLDYILTVDVTEFGMFKQKRGNSENAIGLIDIDFKLIGVADATSDIVSGVSAQVSKRVSVADQGVTDDVLDRVIQRAVDQLVDQVVSTLFPIRVMQIAEDGQIKLNYGAGLLEPGDTVLVYPLGQEVVIDENGEAIGDSVATLQIITSEKKFANAQALDGFSAIRKGQQGQVLLSGG